jgi:hypothetical protein
VRLVARSDRTRAATVADGRIRLRTAQAYLDVAELALTETERDAFVTVSAGTAVLAGIAAADAICAIRLTRIHRGEDHRGAAELLREATPDGDKLAATLLRLLDVKDQAHYGVMVVAPQRTRDVIKWARLLVNRAREEAER